MGQAVWEIAPGEADDTRNRGFRRGYQYGHRAMFFFYCCTHVTLIRRRQRSLHSMCSSHSQRQQQYTVSAQSTDELPLHRDMAYNMYQVSGFAQVAQNVGHYLATPACRRDTGLDDEGDRWLELFPHTNESARRDPSRWSDDRDVLLLVQLRQQAIRLHEMSSTVCVQTEIRPMNVSYGGNPCTEELAA